MVKEKEEQKVDCPVCRFFQDFKKISKEKSQFFEHMNLSQVEFLKAIRSLLDERIENLDSRREAKQGKKATKIKIEEA